MIRSIVLSLALALLAGRAAAQDKGLATLDVRTSSVCDMCEKTIEEGLLYEKGVKTADLDLATNVVHVSYDSGKTSPERIRTAITKLGYYADEQPGDEKAFRNLPACCQKEGCGKPKESKP